MRSQPIALLCCLLTALAPTCVVAGVAEHALEHRETAHPHNGHTTEHGCIPHRNHDTEGDPVPLSAEPGFWAARPAGGAALQLPALVPGAFVAPPTQPQLGGVLISAREFADRRSRAPTSPSPGDTLPLRI